MRRCLWWAFTFFLLIGIAIPLHAAESLTIHYIDVGQGDSILVQPPSGHSILIDGGTASAGNTVVNTCIV